MVRRQTKVQPFIISPPQKRQIEPTSRKHNKGGSSSTNSILENLRGTPQASLPIDTIILQYSNRQLSFESQLSPGENGGNHDLFSISCALPRW